MKRTANCRLPTSLLSIIPWTPKKGLGCWPFARGGMGITPKSIFFSRRSSHHPGTVQAEGHLTVHKYPAHHVCGCTVGEQVVSGFKVPEEFDPFNCFRGIKLNLVDVNPVVCSAEYLCPVSRQERPGEIGVGGFEEKIRTGPCRRLCNPPLPE